MRSGVGYMRNMSKDTRFGLWRNLPCAIRTASNTIGISLDFPALGSTLVRFATKNSKPWERVQQMRYEPTRVCSRCHRPFAALRKCPNEAVNRLLGSHICYYCCRECKHHTTVPMCGAIGCDLWRKEEKKDDKKSRNRVR